MVVTALIFASISIVGGFNPVYVGIVSSLLVESRQVMSSNLGLVLSQTSTSHTGISG